jgi:hypothetical protein
MAIICKKKESKHYNFQCIHGYSKDDLGYIGRYCHDCLAAQAAEKKEVKNESI